MLDQQAALHPHPGPWWHQCHHSSGALLTGIGLFHRSETHARKLPAADRAADADSGTCNGDSAHLLKVLDRDNIRLSIPGPSVWLCRHSLCPSRLPVFKPRSCLELPELLGQASLLPAILPQLFVLHNQVSIQAADLLRQCPTEKTRQVCSDSHVSIQHTDMLGLRPVPYQPAFCCCIARNGRMHRGNQTQRTSAGQTVAPDDCCCSADSRSLIQSGTGNSQHSPGLPDLPLKLVRSQG